MADLVMRYGAQKNAAAGAVTPGSIGAFDLWAGTALVAGQDLDGLTEPGCYNAKGSAVAAAVANSPQTSYGYKLIVMRAASGHVIQLAITDVGACTLYLRRWTGSAWGTWRTINTTQ